MFGIVLVESAAASKARPGREKQQRGKENPYRDSNLSHISKIAARATLRMRHYEYQGNSWLNGC